MLIELERKGKDGRAYIVYRAGYRDRSGKQHTKVFRRKTDAKRWRDANNTDVHRGQWIDPSAGRTTVQEVFDAMQEDRRYADKTKQDLAYTWGRHIPEEIRRKPIGDVTKADVDKVVNAVEGAEARRKVRLAISRLFNSTEELQRLPNPAKLPKRKATRVEMLERKGATLAPKTYLSTAELFALLDALPPRYRMVVEIMARVGLRPGEAFALRVGKIDFLKRTITIDTSTSGFTKTGLPREITLPAVIADDLATHLDAYSNPKDPDALAFPWERNDGPMIDASNFRKVFNRARDAAGITDKLTPNSCRHTAASYAVAHGADIYSIQRMLGHSKASITLDIYGELWDQSGQRLAETLDAAIRKDRAEAPKHGADVVKLHG